MPTEPLTLPATYGLQILWDTGTDADLSEYYDTGYMRPPGVTINGLGRSAVRSFGPPGTAALDCVLPNPDRLYSPGGTLGPYVGRGPDVTFDVAWGTPVLVDADDVLVDAPDVYVEGTVSDSLFTGAIDTAPQDIDQSNPNVQIRALSRLADLLLDEPVIPLWENIRTDQAITVILNAVGWPLDLRRLDEGDTTLLAFWGDGRTQAARLIEMVLASEGVPACAHVDGAGVFHFEGRQFRATYRTTVQWTLTDRPPDVPTAPGTTIHAHIRPSRWTANPDEVVKSVRTSVNVRTATATQKVWEYGESLTLSAGETRDLVVEASDPFKSAVTPVAATDYSVSAGSLSSVSLLTTSGTKITLRLVAGGSGATVIGVTSNGIQVRAVSLPVTRTVPVEGTADVDLSAARYRPKDHTLTIWPEIAANVALDRANDFLRRYQRPRDQMTVRIASIDPAHLLAVLGVRVSDRVLIVHTHGQIAGEFFVEAIDHDLTSGGGLHIVTLHCERDLGGLAGRFGTAQFNIDIFG